MAILTLLIYVTAVALMAKMTWDMAKYNNRRPWLWALLTVFFGAFSMAYVFYTKSK